MLLFNNNKNEYENKTFKEFNENEMEYKYYQRLIDSKIQKRKYIMSTQTFGDQSHTRHRNMEKLTRNIQPNEAQMIVRQFERYL